LQHVTSSLMGRIRIIHIGSILFISLMLLKGIGSLLPLLSSIPTTSEMMMDMENEQEKKGSRAAESSLSEEVFDAATHPAYFFTSTLSGIKSVNGGAEPLPSIYLDTLTPPPNGGINLRG
jgi:hypothetical protein